MNRLPTICYYNVVVQCTNNTGFQRLIQYGCGVMVMLCSLPSVIFIAPPVHASHRSPSSVLSRCGQRHCLYPWPPTTTTTSIISSLSLPPSCSTALCGPATLVMRPECTIRACHTPTAGAAPQPRPGYRLKHPLINTVLPLPPQHTCIHPPPLPVSLRCIQPIKRWRVA